MYSEFTKISFCPKCFERASPRNIDECLVVLPNGTNTLYKYARLRRLDVIRPHTRGFTPHIYTMVYSSKKYVEYNIACGICITCDAGESFFYEGRFFPDVDEADILKIRIGQWKSFTSKAILI